MMAMRKRLREREPTEIELLLPWHATGTLNARDSRNVDEALEQDPKLARQYAVVRREYAETIAFNESLGAPSARTVRANSVKSRLRFCTSIIQKCGRWASSTNFSTRYVYSWDFW